MRHVSAGLQLLVLFTVGAVSGACVLTEPLSAEQASAERAAIDRVVMRESGTLRRIAATRAKAFRPELRERPVVCSISTIDVRFTKDDRAIYSASYACGVRPWGAGDKPEATVTVKLDVLKEAGGWTINGFL